MIRITMNRKALNQREIAMQTAGPINQAWRSVADFNLIEHRWPGGSQLATSSQPFEFFPNPRILMP
jgi:hypothetical protein